MKDLEQLLGDDARTPIADNGFSARVMAALPGRARAPSPWLKPALVFGSAAIGSVAAALLAPGSASLLQGFADLVQLGTLTPAAITALAMAGALLASALVLAIDSD
jgi:hypothetical protein